MRTLVSTVAGSHHASATCELKDTEMEKQKRQALHVAHPHDCCGNSFLHDVFVFVGVFCCRHFAAFARFLVSRKEGGKEAAEAERKEGTS